MGKLSVGDLRQNYSQEKILFERRARVWLYYTGRLPSFYLTPIFLRLNISANQVTYATLIMGLAGCAFIALGSFYLKLVGVLMINLCFLLDCIDGNIARYRKSVSSYGEFIDALVGYIVTAFLFLSLGIATFKNPDSFVILKGIKFSSHFTRELFLFAGLWASFGHVLARLISLRFKTIFTTTKNGNNIEIGKSSRLTGIESIIRNLFGLSGIFLPLLLLAIIFKVLSALVIFSATFNTLGLIAITIKVIRSAYKTERSGHK